MYLAYNCKIIIADIYNYILKELSVIIFSIVQDYSFIPVEIQLLSLRASHKNSCKGRIKKGSRTFDFPVRYFKRRSSNVNRFFPLQFIISRAFLLPSSLRRGSRFPIKQTSRTNKVPIFYHLPIFSRSSPFLLTRLLSKLSLIFQERN